MSSNLRNPIIIFLDEAIGFRKSLHHLHRWFETNDQNEIEQLAIEVCKEHFFDLWPILDVIKGHKDINDRAVVDMLYSFLKRGIYVPKDWMENKDLSNGQLTPLSNCPLYESDGLFNLTANIWAFRDWIDHNESVIGFNPISCIAMMQQYIIDAKDDFKNLFKLLEMLLGYKTLISCVHDGSISLFCEVVGKHYYPSYAQHIKCLGTAVKNSPELNWTDALSRNQVKSKIWLLEKIRKFPEYNKVYKVGDSRVTTIIVGGWVGILPFLANMYGVNLGNVINVDTDTTVHTAAGTLNAGLYTEFKNSAIDIRKFSFSKYKNLVIIDTIVEHFKDHGEWVKTLPSHARIVLQGNDMFDIPDHVNCHKYLHDFITSCGLNNITWAGELNLFKCTRFMAIGTT